MNAWEQAKPAFEIFPALKISVIFGIVFSSLLTLYGFIAGVALWGGSEKGNVIAKQYLLIRLIGSIVAQFVGFVLMGDMPFDTVVRILPAVTVQLIFEGAYFLTWWLYFRFSKRVRNTYG